MTDGQTELYLLRHAHAGDPMAWEGPDEIRPLSKKGRRQSERLGGFLSGVGFRPDAIVTSPKVRALQTAEHVAEALGQKVVIDGRLGGGFGVADLRSLVAELDAPARLVIVGHDPDFSALVNDLCGTTDLFVRKGALVRIDIDGPIEPGAGALRWLIPPDLFEADRR
jgi:phosphohistidine phosphatase